MARGKYHDDPLRIEGEINRQPDPGQSVKSGSVKCASLRGGDVEDDSTFGQTQEERARLKDFAAVAKQCRTTKQFRELVNRLRASVPYRYFACMWGYLPHRTIGFIYNH